MRCLPQRRRARNGYAMRLVLFEPDQPGNAGTLIRTGAALGVAVDVVGPMGFAADAAALKRAAMDYAALADVTLHADWAAFEAGFNGRLVLLTTAAETDVRDVDWRADDALVLGRESVGAPDWLHQRADVRARIAMAPGARSLNVAVAGAMALAIALDRVR